MDGALVTDLPVEEAGDYLKAMKAHKLAPVFLAAPTSTDERLRDVAQTLARICVCDLAHRHHRHAAGAGGRCALAGRASADVYQTAHCGGFGVSTPEQFAEVGSFADAAVVGSAIVHTIEQNPGREAKAVAEFLSHLTGAAQPAAAG